MRSYPRALVAMLRPSPRHALVEFASDVLRALPHPRHLRGELAAWHSTVQVYQDPELLATLLAEIDYSQVAEVHPPSRTEVLRALELAELKEDARFLESLEQMKRGERA
jgi:tRNA A37 N6-isopentenylltransferase MiaA